ncbi:MAG: hypothetical protein PVI78_02775 [Anaerolineales bacterium]|jgi:hypothetical protein
MEVLRNSFKAVSESRRAYAILNVIYYGLILCAMLYVSFNRPLQEALMEAVGEAWETGPLAIIGGAYSGGKILLAIGLTFVVNLVVASFLSIHLPSLILPFSGLLVGLLRAFVWGLLFAPPSLQVSGAQVLIGVLVAGVILLEGQGYVLAMLAAYDHGKAWLFPKRVGAENRKQGYGMGVKRAVRLYLLVALALLIAAVYEVIVTVIILPQLV